MNQSDQKHPASEKQGQNSESKGFEARTNYPQPLVQSLQEFEAPVQMFRATKDVSASISNNNMADEDSGTGEMEGFGATVGNGLGKRTWMTKVEWGGLEAAAHEGTSMDAKPLGPDHPSGESSGHSDDQSKARAQFLSHITGQSYIQGHLLNDNLGGPAERRNLTAIPAKPGNSAHEKLVEKPVKSLMDQGLWLRYIVDVDYMTVTIADLYPAIRNDQITGLDGYDNLPGVKPTTRNSQMRIASAFRCEWYTYQADGTRAGAVQRVNILFPHKVRGDDASNVNDYGSALAGYDDDFITFPNRTVAEAKVGGAAAVTNAEDYLLLAKNLPDTDDSDVPNFTPERLENMALEQWQNEIENSVDDSGEGRVKYPEINHGHLRWRWQDLNLRRIRESRYENYLTNHDKMQNWNDYKDFLIEKTQQDAKDRYAAIIGAGNQTPGLA